MMNEVVNSNYETENDINNKLLGVHKKKRVEIMR